MREKCYPMLNWNQIVVKNFNMEECEKEENKLYSLVVIQWNKVLTEHQ